MSPSVFRARRAAFTLWATVFVAMILVANTGGAAEATEAAAQDGGGGGTLVLVAALLGMLVLGSPLFVIIGVLAVLCFWLFGDGFDEFAPCLTLNPEQLCAYEVLPAKMADLTKKNVLLAIPFFVVSGAIMSAGDIANRLVGFAKALVGWMPGGLAVAAVGACLFFAAISGSSPVTVIAIGSMMFPALQKAGYDERFSMGLVTTAGSLGILVPPSIPMLVFAIVASGSAPIDVGELFLAGMVPGALIGLLLAGYSVVVALRSGNVDRTPFDPHGVWIAFRDGFWAIMLPVIILGGIYSGLFTATEAAAVSVVYAVAVELFIHQTITWEQLPKVLSDSAVMMGTLLIIMALAFGLNDFLVDEKVPDMAVDWIISMDLSPLAFLLIINVFLLAVGALMDSISAILIIAPLLTPIALSLGVDPVHLGVIFIVNLEIGYLTPPIGINLFVASTVFERPMGTVIRSVVPFILLMFGGLALVTYVPSFAMGPVNVFYRDEPFIEPLPTPPKRVVAQADVANADGGGGGLGEPVTPAKGRSSDEMTAITMQSLDLCDTAEDAVDDVEEPSERPAAWKASLTDYGVEHPELRAIADRAIAQAGTDSAYPNFRDEMRTLLNDDTWECEAAAAVLGAAEPSDADASDDAVE